MKRPWVGLYGFNREENFVNLGERLRTETVYVKDLLRIVIFQFLAHLWVRNRIALGKDCVLGQSFVRFLLPWASYFVLVE